MKFNTNETENITHFILIHLHHFGYFRFVFGHQMNISRNLTRTLQTVCIMSESHGFIEILVSKLSIHQILNISIILIFRCCRQIWRFINFGKQLGSSIFPTTTTTTREPITMNIANRSGQNCIHAHTQELYIFSKRTSSNIK